MMGMWLLRPFVIPAVGLVGAALLVWSLIDRTERPLATAGAVLVAGAIIGSRMR